MNAKLTEKQVAVARLAEALSGVAAVNGNNTVAGKTLILAMAEMRLPTEDIDRVLTEALAFRAASGDAFRDPPGTNMLLIDKISTNAKWAAYGALYARKTAV